MKHRGCWRALARHQRAPQWRARQQRRPASRRSSAPARRWPCNAEIKRENAGQQRRLQKGLHCLHVRFLKDSSRIQQPTSRSTAATGGMERRVRRTHRTRRLRVHALTAAIDFGTAGRAVALQAERRIGVPSRLSFAPLRLFGASTPFGCQTPPLPPIKPRSPLRPPSGPCSVPPRPPISPWSPFGPPLRCQSVPPWAVRIPIAVRSPRVAVRPVGMRTPRVVAVVVVAVTVPGRVIDVGVVVVDDRVAAPPNRHRPNPVPRRGSPSRSRRRSPRQRPRRRRTKRRP